MTKQLKCPCCKKAFKRIAQHLAHRPKCSLFLKKYLTRLDATTIYNFEEIGLPNIGNGPDIETKRALTTVNNPPLEINFDFFPDDTSESFGVTEPIGRDNKRVYSSGINYQHFISKLNLQDGFAHSDFPMQLELLQLVESLGAPLQTYDKIMKWAANAYNKGYKFPFHYPNRDNMIQKLSDLFCMRKMEPLFQTIDLHNGTKCKVNYFDFEQMCYSLLSDQYLMRDSNFSFGNNNPMAFQKNKNPEMTCIEDGSLFQNTISEVCQDENDFLLGIKMFIDATHTDVHGDWILDPVSFTFTFFNYEIAREQRSWRTIGFINDLNKKSTAWNNQISAKNKIIDYHSQLRVIFKSLAECQRRGGFSWDFKYKNTIHHLKMKPVLIVVVGDAVGNHKLAGMYNNFSNTYRANHSCSCPLMHTDDPEYSCRFVNQSDIDILSDMGDISTLNKLSYHRVRNAFRDIDLANHEAGINAMMPSEILHQMFLGVIEYVLDSFIATYPPMGRTRMDKFGSFMYHAVKRVSDRTLPKMKTQNGFTNLTRQRGSDRLGICLLLLIMMVSDYQMYLTNGLRYAPTLQNRRNYISIFHKLLCLSEWMSQDVINIYQLDSIHSKIKDLMYLIKHNCHRETQSGWKISKFHELLHVTRDITLLGPPQGYDSRPGESSHKHTKKQARRTQRRLHVFESQTARRIYESLVIQKGCDQIVKCQTMKSSDDSDERTISHISVSANANYYITKDDTNMILLCKDRGQHYTDRSRLNISSKHQTIFKTLFDSLSEMFDDKMIPCRTSVCLSGKHLIRAVESFYDSTPWNDWVWIQWDYGDSNIIEVPALVFCFVDLRSVQTEYLHRKELEPSVYAYVCSANDVPTANNLNSVSIIKFMSLEEDNSELKLRLVNIDSFTRPCFAVPNITSWDTLEHKRVHRIWLYVEPRNIWYTHF